MKDVIIKTLKTYYVVVFFAALIICGLIYKGINGSSTASSTSSDSGANDRTCGTCSSSFSGNGWSTAGGEQFQQTSWSGYGYCSKKCAYDSQPAKWK